jgi:poly(3-hydroxybutyrate) depolymerase
VGTGGSATSPDGGARPPDAGTRNKRGKSEGCGKPASGGDSSASYVKHDVAVTGVDPAFIAAHPPSSGGSWTARTFFLRLPVGYDPAKPYPLTIGGGGCGNTDGTSGNSGGLATLPGGQKEAIQIGLNYVYPQGAGACFADDYVNTPDLPYFDAVLAKVETDYCVDRDRVFVDGFSSGAWETYLLGCARAGVVRGIGTAAGGLRKTRPPCTDSPVAAILVAGLEDMENPIGPLAPPGKNDSLGSAPAPLASFFSAPSPSPGAKTARTSSVDSATKAATRIATPSRVRGSKSRISRTGRASWSRTRRTPSRRKTERTAAADRCTPTAPERRAPPWSRKSSRR